MLWEFFRTNLLWTEGYTLMLIVLGCMLLSYLIYRPVFYGTVLLFVFLLWFFRLPQRECPECVYDSSVIVCPADGKVVDIQFGDVGYGFCQKVTIFLSMLDAHVMWAPVSGVVDEVAYYPGAHLFAFLPKSSLLNEHNDLFITSDAGHSLVVRQIAGTIARRICCWVAPNDRVHAGEAYGMIRFGSAVELFLPQEALLSVGKGQLVVGGQTVLGRWTA